MANLVQEALPMPGNKRDDDNNDNEDLYNLSLTSDILLETPMEQGIRDFVSLLRRRHIIVFVSCVSWFVWQKCLFHLYFLTNTLRIIVLGLGSVGWANHETNHCSNSKVLMTRRKENDKNVSTEKKGHTR
jgi:hypothetical protein